MLAKQVRDSALRASSSGNSRGMSVCRRGHLLSGGGIEWGGIKALLPKRKAMLCTSHEQYASTVPSVCTALLLPAGAVKHRWRNICAQGFN
jgi:hypothetical protein